MSKPETATPPSYNPSTVGNDAAARPWESVPASVVEEVVEEIDHSIQRHNEEDALLAQMRDCFVEMQQAWDRADIAHLRTMMTQDMRDLLDARLLEREQQGPSPHTTEIIVLEAHLLSREQSEGRRLVSVEFSGMVRESPTQAPTPFREMWDMIKPLHDSAARWLVAGVQSLQ